MSGQLLTDISRPCFYWESVLTSLVCGIILRTSQEQVGHSKSPSSPNHRRHRERAQPTALWQGTMRECIWHSVTRFQLSIHDAFLEHSKLLLPGKDSLPLQ